MRLKNGKYRVNIGFKGKQYYVGRYETFDEAVQARLEAENIVHGGFLKAYRIWEQRSKAHPEWAEENPLIFNVKKVNGDFQVETNMDGDADLVYE